MADRRPQRPQYALPDEYGPARAPRRVDDLTDPAVRTVPRDGPAADPPPPPPSRRERRNLRQHERANRRVRTAKARWIRRGIAIAVIVLLIPVAWSYVHALQRPGTDSLSVRSVEWIRDNGGNGIVNTIERWWYTNNPPVEGGKPDQIRVQGTGGEVTSSTKVPTATTMPQPAHLPPPTQRVMTPAPSVENNEGVWMPVGRLVGGIPAEYITFVRPDATHTSYYVAVDVARHKTAQGGVRARISGAGGRSEPVGFPSSRHRTQHADCRVQLRVQDGLRQWWRLLRRRGGEAARPRRGVPRDQDRRHRVGRRVGSRLHVDP